MVAATGVRDAIEAELAALADPVRAAQSQRFFKTGPGEYAEGDRFLGIPVGPQRRVARAHRGAPLEVCEQLLDSEIHEHRFVALAILVERYRRGDESLRRRIEDLYLAKRDRVNNWDLVDTSAPQLLGERVIADPALLDQLARSSSLWDRRIAMLATFAAIRNGDAGPALHVAELLVGDGHDLIHKAVGWMLREVGKRVDPGLLRSFLERHAATMPRTALRYAIERLPESERRMWLGRRDEP